MYCYKDNFLANSVDILANSVDILANNVDPDEMPQNVAFHQGLHCLPKYPFMGFPVCKGLNYT